MAHRVLSVASECVPLVKTGGLADVVGALPGALAGLGWDMRVLVPCYRGLEKQATKAVLWRSKDLFGGPADVVAVAGHPALMLLRAPHLFDRADGPYGDAKGDYSDNPERFAALSRAAADIAVAGLTDGWQPDLVHAHDWQAGLAPAYLRYGGTPVPSVMTIHNIAFQGLAPAARLAALGLPKAQFTRDGLEYWGQLSTLKAGLVTADAVTTVSPTYAQELMRSAFGMGFEGVIASRAADLSGILNGIDDTVWNPEADPALTAAYSAARLKGKAANRAALIADFKLGDIPGPLAIVVSRLTDQKGIDLIAEAAPGFIAQGGGLAILGSGDPALEAALQDLAARFPDRIGLRLGYDEALSHAMFGGGDAVLVPSRFEPCGLTQIYGLRYGAVPVVAATGGLADTVVNANPAALAQGCATGIVFNPIDALGLSQALTRLVALHAEPKTWTRMQKRGMKQDLGWTASATAYAAIYERLLR